MMTNNVRLVKLRSMVNNKVVVHSPSYGIHREFLAKGSVQTIPFDVMEQMLWENGFNNMIRSGILYIDSMEDKIDLGLEEPDTKTPTNIKVFSPEQILTLLKVRSFNEFVDELSTVSIDQANNVVDYAVEHNIIDTQKVDYLKEVTGRDVIQIINNKRKAAEAERMIAEKEKNRRREGEFNSI